MTDMNIESFLIASTINTVIGQRLVRVLCQECREAYTPSEEILNQIHAGFNITEEEKAAIAKSESTKRSEENHAGFRKIGAPSREILTNRSILEAIAEDPSILNRKADKLDDNEEKRISKKDEPKSEIKPSSFGKVTLFKPKGCSKCDNGYKGRMGIYEVLEIDSEIGNTIIARKSAEEIEALGIRKGMLTMQQDGFLKALEGTTTLEEVLRVTKE